MATLTPISDLTGPVGPQGPPGYNATDAAEDAQALADFTNETAGPNVFAAALDDRIDARAGIFSTPEKHGAVGDGVTDDTAALLACIAEVLPFDGTMLLTKKYGLSDELQMCGEGTAVTVVGVGSEQSGFVALTADARISWSTPPTAPGWAGITTWGRPGLCHSWRFDGNLIATQGIFIGPIVGYSTFQNVQSLRCDGPGWYICPQNMTFIQCISAEHSGTGYIMDYGIQACEFINCHSYSNDGWDVIIRQSGGAGWGSSSQPQNLRFRNGILGEQGGSPHFTDVGLGGIWIREGFDITFDGVDMVQNEGDGAMVITPSTVRGYVGRIVVRDSRFDQIWINSNDGGDAETMGGTNEPLLIEGWNLVVGDGIINNSTAPVYLNGRPVPYTPQGDGAPERIYEQKTYRSATPAQSPLTLIGEDGQSGPLLLAQKSEDQTGAFVEARTHLGAPIARLDEHGNVVARVETNQQVIQGDVSGFAGLAFGPGGAGARLLNTDQAELFTDRLYVKAVANFVNPLQVQGAEGQLVPLIDIKNSDDEGLWIVEKDGHPQWLHVDLQQTTVGAAGGASALPATPTKYLKVKDSAGTTLVIPAYAAS